MSRPKRKLSMSRPTEVQAPRGTWGARDLAEGKARLTVDLPEAAHRALKLRAVERGKSIREYILDLLRADRLEW